MPSGGARKGAGRKPMPKSELRQKLTVWILPESMEWLEEQEGNAKARVIDSLIKSAMIDDAFDDALDLPTIVTKVHGVDCEKIPHNGVEYNHDEDDDSPYAVDTRNYCGRCHVALPFIEIVDNHGV